MKTVQVAFSWRDQFPSFCKEVDFVNGIPNPPDMNDDNLSKLDHVILSQMNRHCPTNIIMKKARLLARTKWKPHPFMGNKSVERCYRVSAQSSVAKNIELSRKDVIHEEVKNVLGKLMPRSEPPDEDEPGFHIGGVHRCSSWKNFDVEDCRQTIHEFKQMSSVRIGGMDRYHQIDE